MYTCEGNLEARTDPETLLGQYGLYFATFSEGVRLSDGAHVSQTDVLRYHGDERSITEVASMLRVGGQIPDDHEIEYIETTEQAERYQSRKKLRFAVERRREIDLDTELAAQIPEGMELTAGRLLREVAYSPDIGWHDSSDTLAGDRQSNGLVVPGWKRLNYNAHIERGHYR